MHDIKETGARSTSGHAFKQAIPPTDLVQAYLSVESVSSPVYSIFFVCLFVWLFGWFLYEFITLCMSHYFAIPFNT